MSSIRTQRMRGKKTLWAPRHGPRRHRHPDGGRAQAPRRREKSPAATSAAPEFEKRIWKWKEQSGGRIIEQMKSVGTSCDWTRERFTMDPGLSRAVRETFVRLWEKKLIYRGDYMVNWCPSCATALSDLEVDHEEVQGSFWHIRYAVNGMPGRELVVATTRPETMLGDSAVAVNPNDERYADLHGKTVRLPLMDRDIPIIFDDMADLHTRHRCREGHPRSRPQ